MDRLGKLAQADGFPRRRRGAPGPVLLGVACAVLSVAGCRTSSSGDRGADPWAAAEQATRTQDWKAAADRWSAILVSEGAVSVRPCAETARALLALGDPQAASAMTDLGLKHHPDDPSLLELRADALAALGYQRAAEGLYQRVIELDPDRRSALNALARQRLAIGMERSAIAPIARLIELGQIDYATYRMLARAYQGYGASADAFAAWCMAFTLGEGVIEDYIRAATLCLDEEVRTAAPDASERCMRWLERAIERDPQCTDAHFQIGVLYERAGDLVRAEEAYRRAVETDPDCLMAVTNLALLYARVGDDEGTRAMVARALELETDEGRKQALVRLVGTATTGASEP